MFYITWYTIKVSSTFIIHTLLSYLSLNFGSYQIYPIASCLICMIRLNNIVCKKFRNITNLDIKKQKYAMCRAARRKRFPSHLIFYFNI